MARTVQVERGEQGRRRCAARVACSALLALGLGDACAILGGSAELDPPDTPERRVDANTAASPWGGVGSLTVRAAGAGEPAGTFSATAIDPWHVLTAAHVVQGRLAQDVRFNLNLGGDLSHRIAAAAIHVHPDYAGFRPDPRTGIVHDDIAVVRLESALPFGVPLYRIPDQPPRLRTVLTLVGYGGGGDGVRGVTVGASPSVKRVGRNVFDRALRDNGGQASVEVYLFDFDGPDAASNRMGGPTLGNQVEASLAAGDSGSPAFVPGPQGAWLLVGVNTFVGAGSQHAGGNRYGGIGGGVLLYSYVRWIESVLSAVRE